jgi:hypothetical protein
MQQVEANFLASAGVFGAHFGHVGHRDSRLRFEARNRLRHGIGTQPNESRGTHGRWRPP